MLVVGGQRRSRASICATAAAPGRVPKRASICAPRPMRCSAAAAMRHGSRAAASPPGIAIGARWPRRCERGAVDEQQLAAPGRAVVAQADAVERQAEQRAVDAVLGRDRRHMRVVVLHGMDRMRGQRTRGSELEREARAEEIRVQVVGDGLRLHVEHRAQVVDHLDQRAAGGRVVEVADVRRQEGLVAARDADRVLQPGAGGEHRRARARQLDRPGRVAARAADELRGAGGAQPQHAVVAARDDVAVVHQKRVGDALQPGQGFVVADHQRLAARVGAGHHEQQVLRVVAVQPGRARGPAGGLVEQQELDRRAGQHHAQHVQARRDAGKPAPRRRRASAAARSAARATAAAPARRRRQRTQRAAEARLAAITANGFSSRCLRSRSRATRAGVAGVAGEVEAAEALDRDDLAGAQQRQRGRDRVAGDRPARASTSASAGPHTGQAFGSAWKRRCSGSVYSRRHCGHSANAAMLVCARS